MALLALLLAALPVSAQTPPQNVMEYVADALKKDGGFSPAEQTELLSALSDRFADYAHQIVPRNRPQGVQVVMRMIIEGSFDQVSMDRMADVSFAAYQAISRGAPPDVVEGIALYGYRKRIDPDRISDWANGYKQMTDDGVPSEVAADLIRQAMEQDWDRNTFDVFKWSLVHAAQAGFNTRDYATYLLGNYLKGDRRPGEMTLETQNYFRKLGSRKPDLPPYEGVFNRAPEEPVVYEAPPVQATPEPPPPPPPPPPAPEEKPAPPLPPPPQEKPAPPPKEKPAATPQLHGGIGVSGNGPGAIDFTKPNPEAPTTRSNKPGEWKPAVSKVTIPEATPPQPPAKPKPAKPKAATPQEAGLLMVTLWPGLQGTEESYLGTPYVWGGVTHKGIDCSGLTHNTYGENKVGIPRVSRDQWKIGKPVEYDSLKKGDLVFFNTLGVGVSHVGMVVGSSPAGPKFVQASSSHGVVISELEKNYYKTRYLGARRVVP